MYNLVDSYTHFLLQDSAQGKALIDYGEFEQTSFSVKIKHLCFAQPSQDVAGQERLLPFKKGDVVDIIKRVL